MRQKLRSFLKDESGATAIEYSLLVALVGVGIVTTLSALSDDLFEMINGVAQALLAVI